MIKKIAIGGAVAAAIVGAGTASLAVTGSTAGTPSTTPSSGSTASGAAKGAHKHPGLAREIARRTLHGQVVTQNPKTKEVITHDLIHGSVTAVSATSITVKAADNTSFTYTVSPSTAVRMRTAGQAKGAQKSSIGAVKVGDDVLVTGTGTTSPYSAKLVVDGLK